MFEPICLADCETCPTKVTDEQGWVRIILEITLHSQVEYPAPAV